MVRIVILNTSKLEEQQHHMAEKVTCHISYGCVNIKCFLHINIQLRFMNALKALTGSFPMTFKQILFYLKKTKQKNPSNDPHLFPFNPQPNSGKALSVLCFLTSHSCLNPLQSGFHLHRVTKTAQVKITKEPHVSKFHVLNS